MEQKKQFRWQTDLGRRVVSGALAFLLSVSLLPSSLFAIDYDGDATPSQEIQLAQNTKIGSKLTYDTLYDGFYYGEETIQNSTNSAVNTFVTKVDHTESTLAIVTGVPDNKTPLEAGKRQTVSGQANAARADGQNVLGAVNADFFYIDDDSVIQPEGVCIKNGQKLTDYKAGTYFFGIKNDGTPVIGDEAAFKSVSGELKEAVGGRNLLVQNGSNLAEGETSAFYNDKHPRTAVGITADNDVLLVVADGRSSDSAGLSLSDLADYMISLGAVTALNLDGGGSSTMVVKDKTTDVMTVKNVPSDDSGERPCGNSLLVVDTSTTVDNSVKLSKDSDGYYLINSAADLAQINKEPGGNYRLNENISAADAPSVAAFSGNFDGNGHTISGLTVPLFTTLEKSGTVRNLTLDQVTIQSGSSNVGAVAGTGTGTVESVSVSGTVSGAGAVGGIVGQMMNPGKIVRCTVQASVSGTGTGVGGVVGDSDGLVDSCYANVQVSGAQNVGGIVGRCHSDKGDNESRAVKNNIAEGSVTSSGIEAGGIGGLLKMRTTNNLVKNMRVVSTCTEKAVGAGNVAGLLGAWMKWQKNTHGNVVLSGTVTTTGAGAGYRIGYGYDGNTKAGTASDNYANPAITVNGKTVAATTDGTGNGADLTETQMHSKEFYAGLGFDFENTFDWDETTQTPILKGMTGATAPVQPTVSTSISTAETTWKYLDNGKDPAGDSNGAGYNRTNWTQADFDDSAWQSGKGSFGAKNGKIADLGGGCTPNTLLSQYKEDGTTDKEAFFFRTTVTVADAAAVKAITGSILYDDAAIVYLNGHQIAAFDAGSITGNLQYGGSNAGDPKTGTIDLSDKTSLGYLKDGENTIAVEIHQGRSSSSDIYMDFTSLQFVTEAPVKVIEQNSISMNPGSNATEMNFTWYANDSAAGTLRIAKKNELVDGAMPENVKTVTAAAAQANKSGFYSNQCTVTGLEPDTEYAYQLVNGEKTSEIHTFKTAKSGAFKFLFAGDPQLGASGNVTKDQNGWATTLKAAVENVPDAAFLLSAGDQVNSATAENQYSAYLEQAQLYSLPVATVVGNHDSDSNSYDQHFNVPNESDKGKTNASADYWFRYGNTLFLVLNVNNMRTAEHKAFMEDAISKNTDAAWKVVAMHHSVYSVANHATEGDILQRRNELVPVFKDLDIDVVLQGHDHVYVRSYMMDGLTPVTDAAEYDTDAMNSVTDTKNILYITANSASGSKYYTIQNQEFPYAAVKSQERIPTYSEVSVSDTQFKITTYRTNDGSVLDTFTINRTAEETKPEEPTYTPVVTGDTRVQGFYNDDAALKLELAGRYNSGAMNAAGGSLEIVQYNAKNGFAYAVSGVKGKLIAVDLNGSMDGEKAAALSGAEYDIKSMVNAEGFTYGDMTSVAISPDGSKLAVAIQAENYAEQGLAALFACNQDGTLTLLGTAKTGVQPDMVTFADNSTLLTADEGEPRLGTGGTDPKGSVTVVTIGESNALTTNTVTFESFDSQREALVNSGVLIQKGTNPSTDFEPEYIAVSGGKAYVSLQEANAIAVLDIASQTFTGVYPLGFQDYGVTKVDLEKNDKVELKNYDNVYGIKMPDGISVTTIGGKTYLLTANEGDSRDWAGMKNEVENKTSPTGNVTLGSKVVWFDAAKWDGLDRSKAYVFGGRSFSLYEITDSGLTLVYDSGSDFETITAEKLADYFNCSNDKIKLDNRSGKKGPEPETVTTGTVDGKTYAFVALERIGGVMVYDITDPANGKFVNYINSREFDAAIQGDVSPEGLCFVPGANGRKAMLLAACEVSGTLAAYELTPAQNSTSGGFSSGTTTGGQTSQTTPTQNETTLDFKDVQKGDYYFDAVAWAVKQQITSGTSATEFSPEESCTRGQIVTFLWRAAGAPEPKMAVNPFADISEEAYYYKAVLWAVENGITVGTADNAFSPDQTVTRSQTVTFLYRAAGAPAVSGNRFSDVDSQAYYNAAVQWAAEQGITQGTGADTFSPNASCTRGQIVTFLYRENGGK